MREWRTTKMMPNLRWCDTWRRPRGSGVNRVKPNYSGRPTRMPPYRTAACCLVRARPWPLGDTSNNSRQPIKAVSIILTLVSKQVLRTMNYFFEYDDALLTKSLPTVCTGSKNWKWSTSLYQAVLWCYYFPHTNLLADLTRNTAVSRMPTGHDKSEY